MLFIVKVSALVSRSIPPPKVSITALLTINELSRVLSIRRYQFTDTMEHIVPEISFVGVSCHIQYTLRFLSLTELSLELRLVRFLVPYTLCLSINETAPIHISPITHRQNTLSLRMPVPHRTLEIALLREE